MKISLRYCLLIAVKCLIEDIIQSHSHIRFSGDFEVCEAKQGKNPPSRCASVYCFLVMIRFLERGFVQKSFIIQAYPRYLSICVLSGDFKGFQGARKVQT